ncbi:MAG: hypothetical protein M4D80_00090 [Myxococcota bacterium]|nr:hypothetical protein [Deltaproteobacteria bacterium]MDQ3333553.1 hypothetical protein [Myxococcota bacterium]
MRAISLVLLLVSMIGTAFAERAPNRQQKAGPPVPTRHDTSFKSVPGSKLQVRAVEYNGSTNGTLTVQVKNTEKTAQTFVATGLYFVPEGDPDKAPQRLGAVGPMQMATDGKETSELVIPAGGTVEVKLDVFCIDSHRPSPSPVNRFNIGASKLPKELAATIEQRANTAVTKAKESGAAAPRPAAKSDIQGEVWRSRDAKWVELDGEGKQEAAKKR